MDILFSNWVLHSRVWPLVLMGFTLHKLTLKLSGHCKSTLVCQQLGPNPIASSYTFFFSNVQAHILWSLKLSKKNILLWKKNDLKFSYKSVCNCKVYNLEKKKEKKTARFVTVLMEWYYSFIDSYFQITVPAYISYVLQNYSHNHRFLIYLLI